MTLDTILAGILVLSSIYLYLNVHIFLRCVAQLLINSSRLCITSLSISNPSEAGFNLSIDFKIENAGPLNGIAITNLSVSLSAETGGSVFSIVPLRDLNIQSGSCSSSLTGSPILISNMDGFDTFCGNLLNQSEVPLYLSATPVIHVPIPLLSGRHLAVEGVQFDKTIMMTAMKKLKIVVVRTRSDEGKNPRTIAVDVDIDNASVVSIKMGEVCVDLTIDGLEMATLSAESVTLQSGHNRITFYGALHVKKALGVTGLHFLKREIRKEPTEAWVVGRQGNGQVAWLNSIVKKIQSPVVLDSTLKDIYQSM